MSQVDFFILAGEPSGDLHGAKIVESLLKKNPHLKIAAVSGPHMRKLPIQNLFCIEELSVMGFIDVLWALLRIVKQFFLIRSKILQLNPKSIVFIDYPGFNLRMQNSLRKKGFKGQLIHFICPSVWAWGKGRIPLMEKNLDLLFTFFPFEKECFKHLQVVHVGHPLVQAIPEQVHQRTNLLAIFPGSRTAEIQRNLPIQWKVAKQLQKEDPSLEIAISISHLNKEALIRQMIQEKCQFFYPDQSYTLMKLAKLSLATSGTVTLELALHNTPTIVTYAIRPIDVFIAQKIFKIRLEFFCIVNIIAKREVFPEFFGPNCTFDKIYQAAKNMQQTDFKMIRDSLTTKDAIEETTSYLLEKYPLILEKTIAVTQT
jgi:lipid-A-disaccharide synthase